VEIEPRAVIINAKEKRVKSLLIIRGKERKRPKRRKKEGELQHELMIARKRPTLVSTLKTPETIRRGGAILQPFSLIHPKSDVDVNEKE